MSRSTLAVAGLALILAIGALAMQFVFPPGEGIDVSELDAIRADITQLEQTGAARPIRVAYMDAERAFSVFVLAVSDLRQQITNKTVEIGELRNEYAQGIVARDDFERRMYELNAELLDARMTTASGTLDRMIASNEFADLRSALITLREEAQPLIDEINNLVSTIRVGAIDATEFQNRFTALSTMFEQFDGFVTSAATTKLVQATSKIATEYDFDLVIRKKDVIMYRNPATIDDITELVMAEIQDYL